MDQNVTDAAVSYIEELFKDDHGGHDTGHTIRVYHNAMLIADRIPECDTEIVALAALLHDVDDHKLFDTEDNANARSFLKSHGICKERADLICQAVNSVSFSKNRGVSPETIEGKIVQDADRLDAIGAIGIARTFAFGGEHGRSMESSVQHFHDKLLLLKDMMNTEEAKEIAAPRHELLIRFLEAYDKESRGS